METVLWTTQDFFVWNLPENSASPASQIFRLFFPPPYCAQYSISVYPYIASPETIEDLASGLGLL
ncbi:hypothetical protein N7455_004525 [Penicillium solitum]|uniref:uncharacterized protein n=1 Tax=Penicillium solitum TaxID=60172 RepID=UPI0032C48A9A|nr:hypothetical protein N7536_001681 [Penicillium majusculum]KAJ5869584.1 hypothetical protein N7455_004525 [Penicillium solitum]